MQMPGGWLVDRVRPRVLYASCLVLWSLATLFMGMSGGFVALIILRLMVGGFEAPAYPINYKVATAWFPERERGRVIAFYTSGQFIGLALLTPVLSWLQTVLTWHWVFILTGVVGIIWAAIWWFVYREPRDKAGVNQAEIDLIASGGGLVDVGSGVKKAAKPKLKWSDVKVVLPRRKLWGIYLGQFCLTSTLWFFLTWFPDLPRRLPGKGLYRIWLHGIVAVHRRPRWCPALRMGFGPYGQERAVTGHRLEAADHHRSGDDSVHARRQLHGLDRVGHRVHVDRILRERLRLDHLVVGFCVGT